MAKKKQTRFETETQEAEWWAKNQDFIADRFEQPKLPQTRQGNRGPGCPGAGQSERSVTTITIRLEEADLACARTFAAEKGLRYQTYLKMLQGSEL